MKTASKPSGGCGAGVSWQENDSRNGSRCLPDRVVVLERVGRAENEHGGPLRLGAVPAVDLEVGRQLLLGPERVEAVDRDRAADGGMSARFFLAVLADVDLDLRRVEGAAVESAVVGAERLFQVLAARQDVAFEPVEHRVGPEVGTLGVEPAGREPDLDVAAPGELPRPRRGIRPSSVRQPLGRSSFGASAAAAGTASASVESASTEITASRSEARFMGVFPRFASTSVRVR